jgi:hypothetical protein
MTGLIKDFPFNIAATGLHLNDKKSDILLGYRYLPHHFLK